MATKGSITKTVRINADDLAVFEKIMADKMLSWSGVVHYLVETRGVPQKAEKIGKGVPKNKEKGVPLNNEMYENLMSMVSTFGLSYEQFIKGVIRLLEEGLIYSDAGLKTMDSDLDTSNFKAKCDSLGYSYQGTLDKLTKGMR